MNRYWVWDWLDETGIRTSQDVERVLADPRVFDRLGERAATAPKATSPKLSERLVAGWGLGTGSWRSLTTPDERHRTVEHLLRRTWHYFDTVVVEDALRHELTHHADEPTDARRNWLAHHLAVLLQLKSVGAESLVEFRDKPHPCTAHWEKHLREDGLVDVADSARRYVEKIAREATTHVHLSGDQSELVVRHPLLDAPVTVEMCADHIIDTSDDQQLTEAVSRGLSGRLAYLRADIGLARKEDAAFGTTDVQTARILAGGTSDTDVLFNLQLPMLDDVPIAELIAVRNHNQDLFARFQTALRRATRQVAASDPARMANEIQRDVIEPEIRRISDVLNGARDVLARRTTLAGSLATIAVGCGMLAGAPLAAAAGFGIAAAAGGLAAGGGSYFEAVDEVKRSDMYFLWRAITATER